MNKATALNTAFQSVVSLKDHKIGGSCKIYYKILINQDCNKVVEILKKIIQNNISATALKKSLTQIKVDVTYLLYTLSTNKVADCYTNQAIVDQLSTLDTAIKSL